MKTSITLFVVLLFVSTFSLFAQQQPDDPLRPSRIAYPDKVKALTKVFFENAIADKVSEGYDLLTMNSPIVDKVEQKMNILSQFRKATTLYGAPLDYEVVKSAFMGNNLIELQFITLHDKLPLRWKMIFYKSPKRDWISVSILFDDQPSEFFTN